MPASVSVTSVSLVTAPLLTRAVTVTVVEPAASPRLVRLSDRLTALDAAVESVMVKMARVTVRLVASRLVASPLNTTVSLPSTRVSSFGSMVNVAVPVSALAARVMVRVAGVTV